MIRGMWRLAIAMIMMALTTAGWAIDFFFEPDTAGAEVGQAVWLSGRIGDSPLLRGFTVYMAYDTNIVDLFEAPVPGTLIANRAGLRFNYFDHPPFEPDVLEIGGTIFSQDFWQGPGELFRVRLLVRQCADAPITAPWQAFFVAADDSHPQVTFHNALVFGCARTPAPPIITIGLFTESSIVLRWEPVATDSWGRPLFLQASYRIYRYCVHPYPQGPVLAGSTADTTFVDSLATVGAVYHYFVTTVTGE